MPKLSELNRYGRQKSPMGSIEHSVAQIVKTLQYEQLVKQAADLAAHVKEGGELQLPQKRAARATGRKENERHRAKIAAGKFDPRLVISQDEITARGWPFQPKGPKIGEIRRPEKVDLVPHEF